MIGLALSGGGVRGAYQVGVYKAFLKCGIKIDGFVGTSIGAFNAAVIASGRFNELYDFWYNVDASKIMGFTTNLGKMLNEEVVNIKLIKELGLNVKLVLKNKGLSTSGLKEVLEKFDLKSSLYKSKKDFGLVTVRFRDFKPIYLFKEDIIPENLNDSLMASCYLPIFKLEKIIDDNYYLDGGFFDNIPANSLIDKGYDKVYVVDLEAVGLKRPYNDKKKVIVIKPSRNLGSIINVKRKNIRDNMLLGFYDTLKILKKLDGYDYIFKVKSKIYYNFITSDIDKRLLENMMKFFRTKNRKKLVIKALEYVMKREGYIYYDVYNVRGVIKDIRKLDKNYGVYKFVNKLKRL